MPNHPLLASFAPIQQKSCSNCGTAFTCGKTEPDDTCWCKGMPTVLPLDATKDCFCPACLSQVTLATTTQSSNVG